MVDGLTITDFIDPDSYSPKLIDFSQNSNTKCDFFFAEYKYIHNYIENKIIFI